MYIYRGIVPIDAAWDCIGDHAGNAKMFMGHSHNVTCYPISQGKELNLIAFVQDHKPWTHSQWTQEVTKQEMLEEFKDSDPRIIKMLEGVRTSTLSREFKHKLTDDSMPNHYDGHSSTTKTLQSTTKVASASWVTPPTPQHPTKPPERDKHLKTP